MRDTSYTNLSITEAKKIDDSIKLMDLNFTADTGAQVYAKYNYPTKKPIKKILLLFHGYHVDSCSWFDKLAYTQLGFAVFALDCRGQSGRSEDNSKTKGSTLKGLVIKGVKEGVSNLQMIRQYLDTYRIGTIAQDLHPGLPICTMGESQGGALALIASSLLPNVDTCITQYPYLCDIRHAYDIGYGYSGINDYFSWVDPLASTYDYFFKTLAYIDIKNLVHNITADVHMLVGHKDVICPPECQFALYNNLNTNKRYYIYPEKEHEYLHNSEDLKLEILIK
ncbi:alpha/beta fold hydrolase [Mollicutes bacterium LVI A0078]|nr:alpha/beta fold hydrolase [Mollicutes bacterium LVI A0075]WOO91890.1 alpha/beta fold hydrolase [Mollicutes bacterium LVI A0078]